MTAFLVEIGKKLYVLIWLNDVLDGLAYDTLFFYTFLQICCCIGLYGIFAKMNTAKWWAFLPAANLARLGDICGKRAAGIILGVSKILMLLVCENIVQIEFLIPTEGFLLAGTMAFDVAFRNNKIKMDNFYNAIEKYCVTLSEIAVNYANAESKNVATIGGH